MKQAISLLCISLFCAAALAQQGPMNGPGQGQGQGQGQGPGQGPGQGQGPGPGHNGPPAEVLNACKGKKEGDTASVKTPRGDTMSGRCRLVLVPEGNPARR